MPIIGLPSRLLNDDPLRKGRVSEDHGWTSRGAARFQIIGAEEETLPLVAFNLAEEHP